MNGRRLPTHAPSARGEVRLLTYLAPGLPFDLFHAVGLRLSDALGMPTVLTSDPTRSGPAAGEDDPFRGDAADVGFLCAPSYLWLAAATPPAVELVPAAFVFDHPRGMGRPVHFAELVVAADSPVRSFAELKGARWVYNDPCSLSGYFSVLANLAERGLGLEHFDSVREVGSHHAALHAIETGQADCAAIDSSTLLLARRRGAAQGVRVLESFGPYPVQPIVVRAGLSDELKQGLAAALLAMHEHGPSARRLAACGVLRLAPIGPDEYEHERRLLELAQGLASSMGCAHEAR
jgi:phosphonate transport system substrate-binding protein